MKTRSKIQEIKTTKTSSGEWMTICALNTMLHSYNTRMTPLHYRVTRSSPGLVCPSHLLHSPVHRQSEVIAFGFPDVLHEASLRRAFSHSPSSMKPSAVSCDAKGKASEPAFPSRLPIAPVDMAEGVSCLIDMILLYAVRVCTSIDIIALLLTDKLQRM